MNIDTVKSLVSKMNYASLNMAISKGTVDEKYYMGKVRAFREVLNSVGVKISESKMPMGNTYYFIEK